MKNFDTLTRIRDEFLNLSADTLDRNVFLSQAWLFFNRKYFAQKMDLPLTTVQKLFGANVDTYNPLGYWQENRRILYVAPEAFITWKIFSETLRHEMCHQAVSEIDKKPRGKNEGHGTAWARWMKHVGLPPNQSSFYPQKEILDVLTPQMRARYLRSVEFDNAHRADQYKLNKVFKPGAVVRTWDTDTWTLQDFVVAAYSTDDDGDPCIVAMSERSLAAKQYKELSPSYRYYKAKSEPSAALRAAAKSLQKHFR